MHYTKAVDIWSVGCILAEMYIHRPLFPGKDRKSELDHESIEYLLFLITKKKDVDQLNRILEVVGFPSETLLSQINEDAKHYLDRILKKPDRANFAQYFHEISSPVAVDLLEKMLQLDPNDRITCEQALEHKYFESFHDKDDEPSGSLFDDSYESADFTVTEWKNKIFEEMTTFVPPSFDD